MVEELLGCATIIGMALPYLTHARPDRVGCVGPCTHVSVPSPCELVSQAREQGVLQRYIPCRCSVFSLGTPFFATRAKGGYGSVPLRSPATSVF